MSHSKPFDDDQRRANSDPERRSGWRQVLKAIALAPVRLHRYRAVHTQMLRDALCADDCGLTRRERDSECLS